MNITLLGCGWLGLPLAQHLQQKGHTVIGTTRSDDQLQHVVNEGIECIQYDLMAGGFLPDNLLKKTDWLIISVPPFGKERISTYGTKLRETVAQFDANTRTIFCSSTGVYPQKSGHYDEGFEFLEIEKENALYFAEQALLNYFGNQLTILRLGGLFGPHRHPAKHLQGKLNVENPFGLVNLVHQSDVIRVIETLIEKQTVNGTFNVVYPAHPTRKEYYTKVYRQHDLKQIGFVISPTIERLISTRKIVELLPFQFEHSIYDLDNCLN